MDKPTKWTDERVELLVAGLLRFGVLLSSVVVLAGAVGYLIRYGHTAPHYAVFRGEPEELRSIGGIFRGALSLHSRAIIQMGLLLLIATPVARVALAVFGFARERNWKFVGISALVLAVLLYSLAFGG